MSRRTLPPPPPLPGADGPELPPPPAPPPRKRKKRKAAASAAPAVYNDNRTRVLIHALIRYLDRPDASLQAIWETERAGPDDGAPMLRDVIPWTTFRDHAGSSGWKQRRDEHWQAIKEAVEARVREQAIQKELAEIGILEQVRDVALEHITGTKRVPPKSFEGMVKAYIDLDKHVSAKRGTVTEQTAEGARVTIDRTRNGGQPGAPGAAPAGIPAVASDDTGFTDAEIEAMAHAAAEARAAELDARLKRQASDEADRVEVPAPPVIPGGDVIEGQEAPTKVNPE